MPSSSRMSPPPPKTRRSSSLPSSSLPAAASTLLLLVLPSIMTIVGNNVHLVVHARAVDDDHKFKFFCGSSFADIQADTCADRQWCPSSADDECLVPGHVCFANTPCDAREIAGVSVPTYSLSSYSEYRDPSDKMFCGTDYSEALRVCTNSEDVDTAIGRHCPDGECPDGQICFIDLPCSHFVLTDPAANPFGNVASLEVPDENLPDPGSMSSHYFCGATFQQAAQTCSSASWCQHGTNQECPNGETCFVGVNVQNSACEINAIRKAEFEYARDNSVAPTPKRQQGRPVPKPTNSPLRSNDPKNRKFCGTDWNDASDNCQLERFCPNGDSDCEGLDGNLRCFDYTRCDAVGMTYSPTKEPTPEPTKEPTPSPIATTPTQRPTTAKPSRKPTREPSGMPTPRPTGVPSKKPTHAPLPYGDLRREFWCGRSYFDALENCALRCPSGNDEDCPGNLVCLSGVGDCKNEMGMGVYDVDDQQEEEQGDRGDGGDEDVPPRQRPIVSLQAATDSDDADASMDTEKPAGEVYYTLGGKEGTTGAKPSGSKPTGNGKPLGISAAEADVDAESELSPAEDVTSNLVASVDKNESPTMPPTLPLLGPFEEEMVRIVLYGLDKTLGMGALDRWKIMTRMYIEDFFNKYPTPQMIEDGDAGTDAIRSGVYDVVVEINDEVAELAPLHDFSPLVVGDVGRDMGYRRNLRSGNGNGKHNATSRRLQTGIDPSRMIMVTYGQTASYRSTLDVLNDDPNLIMQHPLETPEYRADYVNYLRSRDFATFGSLEYASRFLYSEWPTPMPSIAPFTPPTVTPVVPGQPTKAPNTPAPTLAQARPTPWPTEAFGCNLCRPGQYGVNRDVIFNGEVQSCMEVYNWFLKNHWENSGPCRVGRDALNDSCCRLGEPVPPTPPPTRRPVATADVPDDTPRPTPPPTRRPVATVEVAPGPDDTPRPTTKPTPRPTVDNDDGPDATPRPTLRPTLRPTPRPTVDNDDSPDTTPRPTTRRPTERPTDIIEIPVDENGLPDASTLAETYYCGASWDTVDSDCDNAAACPSGSSADCPDGEQCIAFTNCGGKFAFVSDPKVEGGGPDPDEVRSTFYCGTSMQFLENICAGATPCPNGPEDCEGDGEKFGCFAFTGCNAQVDPGKFVGFLRPPDEDDVNGPVPVVTDDAANTFFCAATWSELDSKCVDGVPEGARACPSGDILECEEGHGCFAFACGNGVGVAARPAPSPSSNNEPAGEFNVEDMDLLKSTFFCGASIEEIDGDCDNAIPCPSGDECPEGFGCFAFSQCGGVDIDSLVDTFGNTDRPTRAPTVPIEQVCDEQRKMSVNVGYWQSWSIYRDEDCQRMNTATFDAAPYSHVVYSFASIDSSYRLEAWDGTYENEVPLYKEFNSVKQRHRGVKTMIAVGGWTHNDPGPMQKRFSQMAASKSNRQTFASSVVQFMRTYGFDGLDLDWEYPGLKERGGKRADYDNYVLMAKELRKAFDASPEPYELTIAITGNITKLEMGFDLAGLAEYVDWFNIMAYDLWGSWDPKQIAYAHADLRMIDEAVEYMSHFIQRSKLVMGLASYARTYTLSDDDCLDLGCPFDGPGKSGCEGTDGFLPYFEVADMVTSRDYDYVRFDDDSESMVMVTDGNRLISYDNTVSFNRKIQYAEEMCFMGDMLWAIDMLKDGSNPLSSSNGNSAATGDPSDQSFCGKSYQDVIDGCKQPCTSGDSAQCPPDEFCFANTGCSIDAIGAPPPTKCRLCPDPSTQGMRDWLEIEYDGEDTTCGEADMAVINEFAKGTEECDSAKQSLGGKCCFVYPDDPCMLCRSETEFMDLRALADVEFDGESMTCFDLSKRLGPEEKDSQTCMAAQKEHWDTCCYNQCKLCDGQGVKWWNEVELEEEPLNCGELDAKLYADETEEGSEDCTSILDEFRSECCYDYPDEPCDVCTTDAGKKLTLMPNEEVEYEGSEFTCAEVNNFLSPFESSSKQCEEVKGLAEDACCFDRCSLCGEGSRLDPELFVDMDGEEGSCADVEAELFQEKEIDGSEKCIEARSLHYDACCFEIPSEPCQLCAATDYMHFTTEIEFNDDEVTCRSASNYLMQRAEMSSNTCSDAKAALAETCCYSTCNICGEYDLDWDVFVNYEGKDMSCGDFNEIFREEAIADGSDQCEEFKSDWFDTCCYSSPETSCQLCKQGDKFFDLNDNVEVDFNGPTTCFEVANFMSRRTDETEQVCTVTQTSLHDECCYEKCNLADKPGTYPDWGAEVEMNGNKATCLELENAIKEAAIAKDTAECQSLQDAFSPTCSYSIPENACDICPENAVSIDAKADWNGEEMKCSDIKSRISAREEATSEVCVRAQDTLQDSCCIDQCEVCDQSQKTDFVLTVYHEGKTKQCTEIDDYFYENSILASSEECSETKSEHSQCCYTEPETPCNMCKRDTEYFDVMGTNSVTFMGEKMFCSDVSDMMLRREEEEGEACSAAKADLFDTCCDTKCSLCAGMGLEAGVKVSYEGRMVTCLELDLGLGPAGIIAGSDQCEEITSKHAGQCCFTKPESPCRICPGDDVGVNKEASVNYLGTQTTCESLSNYVGSREEQQGDACSAAISDHSDDCCFQRCSLCGEGKADWETFVTYEGQSIACGDFEWILRGKNVEAGSDQCDSVKDEFFDKCCYEPPETSCNLCHVDNDYLDVSAEVQISYQGSQTKCLSLYNSLFVREAADSDQCQAAKDDHAESCCFEKCKICQYGVLDTTATVNVDGSDMSCSALDISFSKEVVVEGTAQCSEKRAEYADACCYIIPDNPCRICPSGSEVDGDVSVDFYGENKVCKDVANKLAISEEAGSETCLATQRDFAQECCFESCPICPEGYNLNWEVDVEYNRATIACGEFDGIIKGNAIQKGTQECSSIRSTFSSACCYNYATASGGQSATQTTLAQVTTTGSLTTNLDTSNLTPSQKEDAKNVFQNLITNTLQSEGVLPEDSVVTVTDIDDNGVVMYEIEIFVNDAVAAAASGAAASQAGGTRPSSTIEILVNDAVAASQAGTRPSSTSSLGEISSQAMSEIDDTLSNPTILQAISDEINSEAPGASDQSVVDELSSANVNDFTPESANLVTTSEAEVTTTGTLESNLDVSGLTLSQKEEVEDVVEGSIAEVLETGGLLSDNDKVTVVDINDEGEVEYEVQTNIDEAVEDIQNSIASSIGASLTNPETLEAISNEIKEESASSPDPSVSQELSAATVSDSSPVETSVSSVGDSTEVTTTGTLESNLDVSGLTSSQKEEVENVVGDSIAEVLNTEGLLSENDVVEVIDINEEEEVENVVGDSIAEVLNTEGLLSENDVVEVIDINEEGEVEYQVGDSIAEVLNTEGLLSENDVVEVIDINEEGEVEYQVQTNIDEILEGISDTVASSIGESLSNPASLESLSNNVNAESASSSDPNVAQELASASVSGRSPVEASVTGPGEGSDVSTTGVLDTNLDLSGLTNAQKEEVKEVVEDSITVTLQNEGVLSPDAAVTVTDINDQGQAKIEVDLDVDSKIDSTLEDVSSAVSESIGSTLSDPTTLEAIGDEIKNESVGSAVADELSSASVSGSTVGETSLLTVGDSTEVQTSGKMDTNIDVSSLTTTEKEEVKGIVEDSIASSLQAEGVLPEESTVTVTDIDDKGEVSYEIDMSDGPEDMSSVVSESIDSTLSDPMLLEAIGNEIKKESVGSTVADELSSASVSGSTVEGTSLTAVGDSTEVQTSGKMDTNIDVSSLTTTEKEEVKGIVEDSIASSLQAEGVLPEESTVTVTDIDDKGEVSYEIDLDVGPEIEPPPPEASTLESVTDGLVSQIDSTLSKPSTLEAINNELQTEAADSSVAEELSSVSVSDFVQGETSVTSTGTATGSGPCNLCKAGEIGLSKELLFNGVQTSCPEVYKYLATQAEDGSDACVSGKEALHDECCMKKCDLCSAGGIPDWYSMVSVNGNSMTCLELDGIISEAEIQSGSSQCIQVLEVAASACCYEPPSKPCNICQNGSEASDVMSSVIVEYGGTTATCGQIFNTLFSREEHDSETCSLIQQDLSPQCCYNKCSLCGGLQMNSALSVVHDETQLGCSEFDSYIFASNLIEEGSGECRAFQDEHRAACCYDISCSLCSKGDEFFVTKETSMVQYGGAEVTCGEVSNFLYQEEMSQGNACLAAQENIFNDCCYQQCELCEAGSSINWSASTSFNGQSQLCTDVYWLLVSESVEAGTQTCNSLSQVSKDCCFEIPSQQCTLCKDENGVTYNTRWNKDVTVNGITKTCGDFNSLLATQEDDSQTCSMAKDTIFSDCCFAGSDTLVAIANQADTESDAPCSLCLPGQVGIKANIDYNNNPTTCEQVYNYLIEGFKESSTTCKSAQVKLAEDCCRDQDEVSPSDQLAFGGSSDISTVSEPTPTSGEGSVTAEKPKGNEITPPMEFDTWTRYSGGISVSASLAQLCVALTLVFNLRPYIL